MNKIFMLTVDGTSSGEYENAALSLLFKTKEEAREYVEKDFIEQVLNAEIVPEDASAEEIESAVRKHCTWYSGITAQFRHGDAIRDYEISDVDLPL